MLKSSLAAQNFAGTFLEGGADMGKDADGATMSRQTRKLQSLEADAASVTKGSRSIIQSRIVGPILFGVLPVRKKRLLRVAILAQAAENVLEALSDPRPETIACEGGHDRNLHPAKLWIT